MCRVALLTAVRLTCGVAAAEATSPEVLETAAVARFDLDHIDRAQMGAFWLGRVEEFRRDNATRAPGGIVFVGDSITQGFPLEEMFPGRPVINRGISGDRIIGVIARLDESVFDLQPFQVFLLIGSNDAGLFPDEMTLPEFERQFRHLFGRLRERAASAEIVIQTVLPIRGEYEAANERIREVNALLENLAAECGFRLLDLHPHFCDDQGLMRPELADDGVHPNRRGQEVWRDLAEPLLAE